MGLFDFLTGKKAKSEGTAPKKPSEREQQRLAKLVGDKMAQNYDRLEALEAMATVGTAEAAAALLRRFGWSMDPSITDQEEKEIALRGIVAAGEGALEPLRSYCARAESLTWPLKVLKEIVAPERYVEELLALLDQFDTEYVRNPEPKLQLILALEAHPSDEVRVAVEPFLGDANESVRFHAVGTCFAIRAPESVPALAAALAEEESLRIKNRIAQGFVDSGLALPDELCDAVSKSLPPGFVLIAGRVARRG